MADINKEDIENAAISLKDYQGTNIDSERAELLAQLGDPDSGKSAEERAAIDKKLLLKVDLRLIPWLSLLYLLSFLDRTNIGNARLAGLEEDLGMSPSDYNLSLCIFFISYALFEPMTNAILKRTTPRVFFTTIIIAWGTIMTLMGLVKNLRGLLAARFFLGVAEAGLMPGVAYYLSCWYKSSEIGLRTALFVSAAALAGSFGGLLAAAIAKMDGIGDKPGWAWIFIIEGLATVIVGIISWWMVFDWPDTARFLGQDDRVRLQRRLIMDKQGRTAEDFDKRHIYEALKDWKTYCYIAINSGCLVPLYAFSLFFPTILRGMGHQGTRAQLLSVPPYAVAALCTIAVGYIADRTKQRGWCMISTVMVGIIGFVLLISTSNPTMQYVATFLGAAGIYPCVPNTISWAANNVEGSLKRGIVVGMFIGFGNINGVVSANIYLSRQAPRFWTGHGVVLGYQVIFLLGTSLFLHFALERQNKYRREGKMDAQWEAMTDEQKWLAGDKRPDFIYTT